MMKFLKRLMMGLGMLLAILASSAHAMDAIMPMASLNQNITTDKPFLYLSDLFIGVSSGEEDPAILKSPAPGQKMTLSVKQLAQIARQMKINWQPQSLADQAIIERNARFVEADKVEDLLTQALSQNQDLQKMNWDKFKAELDFQSFRLALPTMTTFATTVEALRFDRMTGRFTAHLRYPSDEGLATQTVNGRVYEVVGIPVVTKRINNGEIIQARDIEIIPMKKTSLNGQYVMDMADLIGMTPRRFADAMTPLMTSDLVAPLLVKRNEMITVLMQTPQITLTLKARALDEGAKGDVIRVMNTTSNKIFEVTVTAPGQAMLETALTIEKLAFDHRSTNSSN